MINTIDLLTDYGIDYSQRNGWINIDCPFCGKSGKGGFPFENQRFKHGYKCWICGWKKEVEVISELLSIEKLEVKKILKKYKKEKTENITCEKKEKIISKKDNDFHLFKKLTKECYAYLKKRNIGKKIADKYKMKFGGYIGHQAGRIVIPIYHDGKIISYQGRDITEKSKIKYKACELSKEIEHHKNILFNGDNCNNLFVIITEGIFDCLKIGNDCIAVFGINESEQPISEQQILEITKKFKTFAILFDSDKPGNIASEKLYKILTMRGMKGTQFKLSTEIKDPGNLTIKQAKEVKHHIIEILKTLNNKFDIMLYRKNNQKKGN